MFGTRAKVVSSKCCLAKLVHTLKLYCSVRAGNTKGGSITVPLTSCLTDLDYSVLKIKTKNASCHTADSDHSNRRSMVQWYFPL